MNNTIYIYIQPVPTAFSLSRNTYVFIAVQLVCIILRYTLYRCTHACIRGLMSNERFEKYLILTVGRGGKRNTNKNERFSRCIGYRARG